jgi:flagellar biosynthesis protein FliR
VTIGLDAAAITAFSLALVRAATWFLVVPPFNTRTFPSSVKAIVVAALAIASVPHVATQDIPYDTGPFIAALVSQGLIGLGMGLLTALTFHALQSAGALIDTVAGFSLASIYDPLSDNQNAVFGRAYQLVGVTLMFALNAHLLIVRGFLRSFEVVPISGFSVAAVSDAMTRHLGFFFVAAMEIAGPVMAVLFLTEMTLGLLSRAAPSLNIFALAFPVRIGVALIATGISLPLVVPSLVNLVDRGVRASLGG